MSDQPKGTKPRENDPVSRRPGRNLNFWMLLILLGMFLAYILFNLVSGDQSRISLGYFQNLIENRDPDGKPLDRPDKLPVIEVVEFGETTAEGIFREPLPPLESTYDREGKSKAPEKGSTLKKRFIVNLPQTSEGRSELQKLVHARKIRLEQATPSNPLAIYIAMLILFSVGLLLMMYFTLRRSQNQMMGGGGFLSGFTRSPAKKYEASAKPITFGDVAGLEGVKADLQEIVDFLKEPAKYRKLGGRVPKGVLLIGPPGTGKTLLARAVAGEAEVPFYSVNGSEFIQMFVGVGASRVRDLFQTAKAHAPGIIFIDEIDAVGRQRGAGLGGGHDEREQTLNQILGEMDGFEKSDSVIILAATNRPDVLDPALLRPGRFDRHVSVSRPTMNGRLAIFKVHVRDVPLGPDVDLKIMSQATVGMTGADIQNLVNEAALWAARHNKNRVEMTDFYYAHDKVLMGAKREEILSAKEKERTACHEAGHTLAAWSLSGAMPVHKVTVIPRGRALGVTQMVPDEDRMNMSENEIRDNLIVLLAGRAAEKLAYDEFTVGAESDLDRASSMARKMVTQWGMSERLGPVSYKISEEDPFLGREIHQNRHFSEHTMEVIDEEVGRILREAAKAATELLMERRADLQKITDELVEREELDRKMIEALIGPSVHKNKTLAEGLVESVSEAAQNAETGSI